MIKCVRTTIVNNNSVINNNRITAKLQAYLAVGSNYYSSFISMIKKHLGSQMQRISQISQISPDKSRKVG
jgi:hypothetical protein